MNHFTGKLGDKYKKLGIRKKIFVVNFLLLVCLMIVTSFYNGHKLREKIHEEEYRLLQQARSQFLAVNQNESDHLSTIARDWSEWDDAANYLRDKKDDFVKLNLNDSTLSIIKVDYLAYFDIKSTRKTHIESPRVDLGESVVFVFDSIAKSVNSNALTPEDGFLKVEDRSFRYSAKLVKNTGSRGASSGALVFAKELTNDELQKMSIDGQWNVVFGKCDSESDTFYCSNITIPVNNSRDSILMSISIHSSLDSLAYSLQWSQTIGMIFLASVVALLAWWFIEIHLLKRIVRLSQAVENVASGQWDSKLLGSSENDEIGRLTKRIDAMIVETQNSHDELAKALIKAEEAQKVRSTFFTLMSHDLRTPLNGVIGMTSILLKNSPRPAQREGLEMVQGAAEALLCSLNDILDFAKIEQERMELSQDVVLIEHCLESTLRILSLDAHRKGLELTLQLDVNIPSTIIVDEQRFRQIVNNLTNNAIKYSQQGEITVRVQCLEWANESAKLHFLVKDQGCGIEPLRQKEIFRPFVHGDEKTAAESGGVGLGLTIAAEIANSMGSGIELNSEIGIGSEFSFTLDLLIPECVKVICPPGDVRGGNSRGISIITKSQFLAGDIREKLLRIGFSSQICVDWESLSLQAKTEEGPSLWIVDSSCLPKPRLDSIKPFLNIGRDIKIILLTDSSRMYDPEDAKEIGISSIIRKPFAPNTLLECVRNELRESRDVSIWTSSPVLALLTQGVLQRRGHRVSTFGTLQAAPLGGVILLDGEDLHSQDCASIQRLLDQNCSVILLGQAAATIEVPKGLVALHKPIDPSALIDVVEHLQKDSLREETQVFGIYEV